MPLLQYKKAKGRVSYALFLVKKIFSNLNIIRLVGKQSYLDFMNDGIKALCMTSL